jgi:diguanylate cyclase (GGDEF)-like protein/PAS domain S-box-containing protein
MTQAPRAAAAGAPDDDKPPGGGQFFRYVVDNAADGFFVIDEQRRFVEANAAFCRMFGYPRNEVLGKTPLDVVAPESHADLIAQMRSIETTEHRRYRVLALRKDGSKFPILLNNTSYRDSSGAVAGSFGFITDLTSLVEAQQAVVASERELQRIIDQMQDTYYRTDAEGKLDRISPSVQNLLGYAPEELVGRRLADVYADPKERQDFLERLAASGGTLSGYESRLRHKEGHEVWVETNSQYLFNQEGSFIGVEGISRDNTERRRNEARIEFLAHHDPLTDLPNRLLLRDRLERAIVQGERTESRVALVFIDLDRFKTVNDSLGHPVGDRLLREAAQRLRKCVREMDTVSRQGGDEFLIVLTDLKDSDAVTRVAEEILATMSVPFSLDGHDVAISCSVGVAVFPEDGRDFDELLKKSDIAMYNAKEAGRNAFRYYTERMNIDALERLDLQNRLWRGLERDEFILHYQPVVELATHRIVGAEALVRWNSPDDGLVMPGRFIAVAEECGLIVPLGDWVLREACRQLRRWHDAGHGQLFLAVNLSAIQFRRGSVEESVIRALRDAGADPSALELELTESILLQGAEHVLASVRQLKSLGVKLSIDDFGTGYSSLAYLKRFAVDKLKIDQSFVSNLPADADNAAIVGAVVQMAKSLNLQVVAEGVESEQAVEHLRSLECDYAQGYHFGRPVAAEEFLKLIH